MKEDRPTLLSVPWNGSHSPLVFNRRRFLNYWGTLFDENPTGSRPLVEFVKRTVNRRRRIFFFLSFFFPFLAAKVWTNSSASRPVSRSLSIDFVRRSCRANGTDQAFFRDRDLPRLLSGIVYTWERKKAITRLADEGSHCSPGARLESGWESGEVIRNRDWLFIASRFREIVCSSSWLPSREKRAALLAGKSIF